MNCRPFISIVEVVLLFIISLVFGCAAGNLSSEQQAVVDSLHQASFELPGHVRRIYLSAGGLLEVETTESMGAYEKGQGQRSLFDLRSMRHIWSGGLQEGFMIMDEPSTVIVKKQNLRHWAVRYDRQGQILWETPGKGLFVFGLGVEDEQMLLTLSLEQVENKSVSATINGIHLDNGSEIWRTKLGEVSFSDDKIGSLWRNHNRLIFAYKGNAFLLLENRAICMSIKNGEILFDMSIPAGNKEIIMGEVVWIPLKKDVVAVAGPHIIFMSKDKHRKRYIGLGDMYTATEAQLHGRDLIIAFSGKNERGVGVIDLISGSFRWKTTDDADSAYSPKGLVVSENTIVIASKKAIHGFDFESGNLLYDENVLDRNVKELIGHGANMILIGPESISCRSIADGRLEWSKKELSTPLALYYSKRESSMASLQASMQASATIAANSSRYYSSMANQKIGGSYSYDPWTRTQYSRLSHTAGRSAATSAFGTSLVGAAQGSSSFIDRMVSVIVEMRKERPIKEWAYYLLPMKSGFIDYETNTGKLLAIRLSDGTTREIPIPAADMTCIPAVMASEQLGLIIEAYHKFPFCKQGQTIDVLKLPANCR